MQSIQLDFGTRHAHRSHWRRHGQRKTLPLSPLRERWSWHRQLGDAGGAEVREPDGAAGGGVGITPGFNCWNWLRRLSPCPVSRAFVSDATALSSISRNNCRASSRESGVARNRLPGMKWMQSCAKPPPGPTPRPRSAARCLLCLVDCARAPLGLDLPLRRLASAPVVAVAGLCFAIRFCFKIGWVVSKLPGCGRSRRQLPGGNASVPAGCWGEGEAGGSGNCSFRNNE